MMSPFVSVVMPVWNAEAFLSDSLASIQAQTFSDFELIAVDDGSTDATATMLDAAAQRDKRIRVIRLARNGGVVGALNAGLAVTRGHLVARQDADDTSEPQRLARQVALMSADPALVLVGTFFQEVAMNGTATRLFELPQSDTAIRWRMHFDNAFCHTSVMFRRVRRSGEVVRYRMRYVEDYDLWVDLLNEGRGLNLSDVLVTRRSHGMTCTVRESVEQRVARLEVARRLIGETVPGLRVSDEEIETFQRWYFGMPTILGPADLVPCLKTVRLLAAFCASSAVDRKEALDTERVWHNRMLASIPDYRYRLAWRLGLMSTIWRRAPIRGLRDLGRRLRDRRVGVGRGSEV